MFPIVCGIATAQSSGSSSLALTINNDSPAPEVILPQQGTPSNAGDISFSASASGGSGTYTYSWTLVISDDGGGMLSIDSQGTQDQQSYDDSTVVGGSSSGAPAIVQARCTVDDNTGNPTVTVTSEELTVLAFY